MVPFLLRAISSTKDDVALRLAQYLNLIPADEKRKKLLHILREHAKSTKSTSTAVQKIYERLKPYGDLKQLPNSKIHEICLQLSPLLAQISFKSDDQAAAATAAAGGPTATAASP
jgi:hypothetical protein